MKKLYEILDSRPVTTFEDLSQDDYIQYEKLVKLLEFYEIGSINDLEACLWVSDNCPTYVWEEYKEEKSNET